MEEILIGKLSDANAPLAVLHADEHLLVFDKPSGLLSVPGRGPDKQDCLSARAQAAFADALVVHRLDMATSGLFLMGRGAEMQRRLSAAFAQREVDKRYVALVAGRMAPPGDAIDGWGLIDLPLAADWPNRPRRIVDAERGKPSQTRWRVLEYLQGGSATRVELAPLTGRSHQLRVHMQAMGHPILGDALYAPPEVQAMSAQLQLQATRLRLAHPASGELMGFEAACRF